MVQVTHHWEFHVTVMKEVVEVFHLPVVEVKTRKDQGTSGVAPNVEIHVLLWNVSPS